MVSVEPVTVGLESGQQLDPGDSWFVVGCDVPPRVGEKVSDGLEVSDVVGVPVVSSRKRFELEYSCGAPVGISEGLGNSCLGWSGLCSWSVVCVVVFGVGLGLQNLDNHVVYLSHKSAIVYVSVVEPKGSIDNVGPDDFDSPVGDSVSAFVAKGLGGSAEALLDVFFLGVPFDLGGLNGVGGFSNDKSQHRDMDVSIGLEIPWFSKVSHV